MTQKLLTPKIFRKTQELSLTSPFKYLKGANLIPYVEAIALKCRILCTAGFMSTLKFMFSCFTITRKRIHQNVLHIISV